MLPTRPRLLAAAMALGLLVAAPAFAQIREGVYAVDGTNPDGTTYDGQLALRPGPAGSWVVNWRVGTEQILGLGLINAGVLGVGFVINNRPGVAVYEVLPDGKLRGSWTTGGGMGTELLSPQ
ncbi:hypothetical protein [Roseicella aquatilis]|uniref:hypothetical protein n=1 Tax=Roseicella aquatilis TaxID=2527868 RepID=UPI001051B51C|nr:hypothetical protein [Roseicella aquatilis]